MNNWKLITGIALVFILGALVGSIGTRLYFERQYSWRADRRPTKTFLMERLSKELGLTQEQKGKIEQIVGQIEEKRREYSLQRQVEIEKLIDQIKKELNDDQRKKLDTLRAKFERRRKMREGR
jgi:hypothetical protein